MTRFSFSQEDENRKLFYNAVDSIRQLKIQSNEFDSAFISSLPTKDSLLALSIRWKYNHFIYGDKKGFPKESIGVFEQDSTLNSVVFKLYFGDFLLENGVDEVVAYTHFQSAYQIAEYMGDSLLICESLRRMVDHVNDSEKNFKLLDTLSRRYMTYAFDEYEIDFARLHRNRALSLIKSIPYIEEFMAIRASAKRNGSIPLYAYSCKLLGVKYDVYADSIDENSATVNRLKSIDYSNEALKLYERYQPTNFEREEKIGLLINKGIAFDFLGEYDSAYANFNKANQLVSDHDDDNNVLLHKWLSRHFKFLKMYDSAYYHKNEELKLRRAHYRDKIDVSIAEIDTRYGTAKKERENLQLKAENERAATRSKNYVVGSLSVLFLVGSIAILLQKNANKRRLLAEKEREIESRKVDALMKDQELANIDAMLEGQEKERLKVADELHDDLGSLMATIKLHIESFKKNQDESSIDSARLLLDRAYDKIRNISHVKNSGVYSKEGLLPAIRNMTADVMAASRIEIEVMDFGMESRLSNSLELTLFRAVQELIANSIKHSYASKLMIQFTHHTDCINLMIEDNGVGFDPGSTLMKTGHGMGLSNIERKIEELDGRFIVESVIGKGTSVVIDIPI